MQKRTVLVAHMPVVPKPVVEERPVTEEKPVAAKLVSAGVPIAPKVQITKPMALIEERPMKEPVPTMVVIP